MVRSSGSAILMKSGRVLELAEAYLARPYELRRGGFEGMQDTALIQTLIWAANDVGQTGDMWISISDLAVMTNDGTNVRR